MNNRQVAVITGTGEVQVQEEKIPKLKRNHVLIKVDSTLISPGTEIMVALKGRRENPDRRAKDLPLGYSAAGTVIEVNGKCPGLEPGMRVAAMGTGAHHCNYACVPARLVVPISDKVSFEDAAYACLSATALQSVRRTVPQLGEFGAVLGLGIVGNLAAQFYKASGARVIGWEGLTKRISIARKCGLKEIANFRTTDAAERTRKFAAPYGLDFANFAFGGNADKAFNEILDLMKKSPDTHQMGRIVLVGGCHISMGGGAHSGNVDVLASSRTGAGYRDPAYEAGTDYPNALVQFTTKRNLEEVVALMAENRLVVKPMTTHRCPLSEVVNMADQILENPGESLGVILKMSH